MGAKYDTTLHRRCFCWAGALWVIAGCALTPTAHSQNPAVPANREPRQSITDVRIRDYKVAGVSMQEALKKLRGTDIRRVIIGFERVPHSEQERGGTISIEIADATLGTVVQRLCAADPRYEFQVIEKQMFDVRPRGALANRADLLNIKVSHYKIDSDSGPYGPIYRIPEQATELREFLYRQSLAWSQRTGIYPGSPGALVSSSIPPPTFSLDLHDVTVRQILDAISLKSIAMYFEGPAFDKMGRQIMPYPTGWEYEFIIKPNAPTGLDGYPKWEPL